ncbi:MAG: PAS domain-containing protein, partial [Pseudonocardia sp.]|nr:PAS domain-containing protein [Pseudonocardia sp.]
MADVDSTMEHLTTTDPISFVRAIEELPAGVLVYQGPDHVVIGANRAARSFLADRPGILGLPLREMWPEGVGQNVIGRLDHVYATGEQFSGSEWRIEVDGHSDGGERFVDLTVVRLTGPEGTVSGVACQFADVTARVRARRALEVDAADLRERYEAAQDVVLTLQRSLLPDG